MSTRDSCYWREALLSSADSLLYCPHFFVPKKTLPTSELAVDLDDDEISLDKGPVWLSKAHLEILVAYLLKYL